MVSSLVMTGGHKIPTIGFGTAGLRGDEGKAAVNSALENGYRHIDTAHAYGNEKIIGEVLKEWFSEGKLKREDVFIVTKLPSAAVRPDLVEKTLKESLDALQLDYVDLYLIHQPNLRQVDEATGDWVSTEADIVGVWKKMEEQVQAGRAKEIGISNFNKDQIQKLWDLEGIKPACLQVRINIYFQQPELREFCQEKNIVVVAYSSLRSRGPPGVTSPNSFFEDGVIQKIATKHNKSPAQIILRYFLHINVITIPKSQTPSRQKENLDVFNFSLDENDVNEIKALDKGEAGRPTFEGMGRGGGMGRGRGMGRGGSRGRGGPM